MAGRVREQLIVDIGVSFGLESAIFKLEVFLFLLLAEPEDHVLFILWQRVIEAVRSIHELISVQWLLQLFKFIEEWLEHFLKGSIKSLGVHLGARDLTIVIRIQPVEEEVDFRLLGLLHYLLAKLVGFCDVLAHAFDPVFLIPSGLLLLLQDQRVALVEVHGYPVCASWPVSEDEGLVRLWLEHFCASYRIHNAVIFHLLLLFLYIMEDFSLLGQSFEHLALGATSILERILLFWNCISTREVSHPRISNEFLWRNTSHSWFLSFVLIFLRSCSLGVIQVSTLPQNFRLIQHFLLDLTDGVLADFGLLSDEFGFEGAFLVEALRVDVLLTQVSVLGIIIERKELVLVRKRSISAHIGVIEGVPLVVWQGHIELGQLSRLLESFLLIVVQNIVFVSSRHLSLIGVVKGRVIQEAYGVITVQDLRPVGCSIVSYTNLKTGLIEILHLIKRVVGVRNNGLLVGYRFAPLIDLRLEIELGVQASIPLLPLLHVLVVHLFAVAH